MRVGLSGRLVEALALRRWLLVIARHGPSSVLLARLSDPLSGCKLRVSRSWCSLRGGSGGAQVGKLAALTAPFSLYRHLARANESCSNGKDRPCNRSALVPPPTSGAGLLRADHSSAGSSR